MSATSLLVRPEALVRPADHCDRAGEELAAVARALTALTAETGRCDSTVAVEAVLDALGRAVAGLAASAHADATGLRAAAAGYAAAERRASGY